MSITEPDFDAPLATKVAFGVSELDRLRPDWDKNINLDSLRMSNADYCVLGQLDGDYGTVVDAYDWSEDDAMVRGFTCGCTSFARGEKCDQEYKELTVLWSSVIKSRRVPEGN